MKRRKDVMNGWQIAGVAVSAIILIGILANGKDLLRYIRISSM
jgi:hypothetical protein